MKSIAMKQPTPITASNPAMYQNAVMPAKTASANTHRPIRAIGSNRDHHDGRLFLYRSFKVPSFRAPDMIAHQTKDSR